MQEVWKNIDGFDGKYQISTWGNVRNRSGKILKPYKNKKGYLKVGLFSDGVVHKYRINRLVATAFIPNPFKLPQVNHKDGNKQNNSITNLEWVTDAMNKEHAMKLRRGEYVL